jgi:membrane protein implicated in regulation of membrane protease activity
MALRSHRTLRQIFALPIIIGILSTVGLLAALIGDGWWDGLSWATLSLPVLLYFFYFMRRRATPPR